MATGTRLPPPTHEHLPGGTPSKAACLNRAWLPELLCFSILRQLGASKATCLLKSQPPPQEAPESCHQEEEAAGPSHGSAGRHPSCQAHLSLADSSIGLSEGPGSPVRRVGGWGCDPDSWGLVQKASQGGGAFQPSGFIGCNFLNRSFNSQAKENHRSPPRATRGASCRLPEIVIYFSAAAASRRPPVIRGSARQRARVYRLLELPPRATCQLPLGQARSLFCFCLC